MAPNEPTAQEKLDALIVWLQNDITQGLSNKILSIAESEIEYNRHHPTALQAALALLTQMTICPYCGTALRTMSGLTDSIWVKATTGLCILGWKRSKPTAQWMLTALVEWLRKGLPADLSTSLLNEANHEIESAERQPTAARAAIVYLLDRDDLCPLCGTVLETGGWPHVSFMYCPNCDKTVKTWTAY